MAEESFQNNFFDTEYLMADLKGRSVRGGAVTIAAQWIKFCLQMASTVVLARLLTPQDFGLIAMVMVVTGFVTRFKDMGLSTATIQKAEINHDQISTLFWVNLLLSFGLALIAAALAPAVTWFYGEPRLMWITVALASGIIFGGVTIQHQALLIRQMRFSTLAIIDIVSMAAGILAGIIAAYYGLGYWALVIMHLAQPITRIVIVWFACRWRPGFSVRVSGVREMLAFGGYLTGYHFMNYFAWNGDNLLIGKFWGAGQLGLYTKAYALLMLPIQQITTPVAAVAIPALSRLQNEPERYRTYYYRAISMIAFITMPLVAMLAALSDEVIVIALGTQWAGASPIFKVLAFAAFFQPVVSTIVCVYVSLGQTKRMMHWGAIAVPIILVSFVVGLPWGALGVALSYTVCFLSIIMVPSLVYAFRRSPIRVVDFFRALLYPAIIAAAIYFVIEVMRFCLGTTRPAWILVWCCVAAGGIYIGSILCSQKVRSELVSLFAILKIPKKFQEQ